MGNDIFCDLFSALIKKTLILNREDLWQMHYYDIVYK